MTTTSSSTIFELQETVVAPVKRTLRREDAAAYLNICIRQFQRVEKNPENRIRAITIGGIRQYLIDELNAYIDRQANRRT